MIILWNLFSTIKMLFTWIDWIDWINWVNWINWVDWIYWIDWINRNYNNSIWNNSDKPMNHILFQMINILYKIISKIKSIHCQISCSINHSVDKVVDILDDTIIQLIGCIVSNNNLSGFPSSNRLNQSIGKVLGYSKDTLTRLLYRG